MEVPPNAIPTGAAAITPEMLPLVRMKQAEIDAVVAKVPGGVANVQDIYPLAPLQEGILFHHMMSGEGDIYLLPTVLGFGSRARLERFVETVQRVIDRHDILRTAVMWEGLEEPVQVVQRRAELQIETVAFDPEQGAVIEQLKRKYDPRRYRLDVREAPLLRGFAAEEEKSGRWLLLILAHHLAMDHTTLEVLVQETEWIEAGRSDELSAPVPFRNFVAQARLGVSRGGARGVLPEDAGRCRRADGAVRAGGCAGRRERDRRGASDPGASSIGGGAGACAEARRERGEPDASGLGAGAGACFGAKGRGLRDGHVRAHAGRRRRRPGTGDVHQHACRCAWECRGAWRRQRGRRTRCWQS